jgi:hypothetical protein
MGKDVEMLLQQNNPIGFRFVRCGITGNNSLFGQYNPVQI